MLFNSFAFLLVFLPLALISHGLAVRFAPRWRLVLLLVLSLAFYSYWDWRFLPLLAVSIAINWFVAQLFVARRLRYLITGAIVANLAVLGVFKYLDFFLDTAAPLLQLPRAEIALPLGISFFTFHHIMYLIDLRRGLVPRYDLVHYGLYIAFFPQVLAGPLVRWREIMPQLDAPPYNSGQIAETLSRGLFLLVIGLAKKTLLGDPLSEIADPVFAKAAAGHWIPAFEAWRGMLAFTFQIYFDFSGYTDMALGIAMMFGIQLPQNFNAPYRATSLQDFWRRWHMTLSRFLRDYLYIPFGGNRHGLLIQLYAIVMTMALGGLWHGASWTFVIWGLLHGLALAIGVLWRLRFAHFHPLAGWVLTATFVSLTWVLFRAGTFDAAVIVYGSLFGLGGLGDIGSNWLIALAAVISIAGRTVHEYMERLRPDPLFAAFLATLFVGAIYKIAGAGNHQFIYFQF